MPDQSTGTFGIGNVGFFLIFPATGGIPTCEERIHYKFKILSP